MSNFKGWTSEAIAEREQRQLSERLDAQVIRKDKGQTLEDLVIPKSLTMGVSHADGGPITNQPIKKGKVVAMGGNAMPRPTTKDQPEYKIQAAYVRTMNTRHPDILVFSDCAAHIKKTKFQQMRANALSSPREKWPDVFVAQPSGDYAGLYLEFKAESPYYKNEPWKLKKDDHIQAQAETMLRLCERGYYCLFVWSVEQAIEVTEKYLNQ